MAPGLCARDCQWIPLSVLRGLHAGLAPAGIVSAFTIIARDGAARTGTLLTNHGVVETPAFMPVGTHATVKACHPGEVRTAGAQIILANSYHLALRPGVDLLERAGG